MLQAIPSAHATLLGRSLFGAGLVALGVQHLLTANFPAELVPLPKAMAATPFLAWLIGVVLIAAGAAIAMNFRLRVAALVAAAVLFLIVVTLHLPRLATHLNAGAAWTPFFEVFAMAGAALIAAGTGVAAGRVIFGASLPVFGVLHFIFRDYVAAVIPGWIPGHLFWAYFTGVAHFAAGVAIVTRIQARLAATLLGIMFGSWVLLLHIPRVAADSGNRAEWTSLFVAITLCGGAWLITGSLPAKERAPVAAAPAVPVQSS
jgi:uncharacterized membrane protein